MIAGSKATEASSLPQLHLMLTLRIRGSVPTLIPFIFVRTCFSAGRTSAGYVLARFRNLLYWFIY